MTSPSKRRKVTPATRKNTPDEMLTMQQAMDYLTERNFPCRSRKTFYRLIDKFDIPYTNMNPTGTYEVRRFPPKGLQEFLKSQGLEP